MLTNLRIENFVHIKKVEMEFAKGLVVITGETGVGKSVLVNAVSFLSGRQADEDFIKQDAKEALIEGVFVIREDDRALYAEFLDQDESQLIIYRKLSRGKGNVVKINNQTATLKKLREITTSLINISSQHDQQILFDETYQLNLLDLFDQKDLDVYLQKYREIYQKWREKSAFLAKIKQNEDELFRKKEFLEFQIQDIEKENFKVEEEKTLLEQKKEVNNAEKIRASLNVLRQNFDGLDELWVQSCQEAQNLQKMATGYNELLEFMGKAQIETQEYLAEIRKKEQSFLEIQELDIETIEARLDVIFRYKHKYKVGSLAALLDLQTQLNKELLELKQMTSKTQNIDKEVALLKTEIKKYGEKIHQKRHKNAQVLAKMVNAEMRDLGFDKARFEITVLWDMEKIGPKGADRVEFLISTIVGSELKPIQKIASGGELSRLMLAIRTIFARNKSVNTLLFDEIDAGVGGIVANKIGEKLKLISAAGQTFCITHLAQVAKHADYHYALRRQSDELAIYLLKEKEVVSELQRMVGGAEITNLFK